jgi:hypothetical protein
VSEPQKDAYGVYRDAYGTPFVTRDGGRPTAGTPIEVLDSTGNKSPGTWTGQASNGSKSS